MVKEKKISLNVTISPENLAFLEKMVESNEFASLSHGIDLALTRLRKSIEGEQLPR